MQQQPQQHASRRPRPQSYNATLYDVITQQQKQKQKPSPAPAASATAWTAMVSMKQQQVNHNTKPKKTRPEELRLPDDMTGQEKLQLALQAFARKMKERYGTKDQTKSAPVSQKKTHLSTLKKNILEDRIRQSQGHGDNAKHGDAASAEGNSNSNLRPVVTHTTRKKDIVAQYPKKWIRDPVTTGAGYATECHAYADHPPSEELDNIVKDMISTALAFQLKQKIKSNSDTFDKRKRRIVAGMREVKRDLKTHKLKLLVIARNIDPTPETQSLEKEISTIQTLAKEQNVPIAYSLTRRQLGRALGKNTRQSIAGFYNFDGLQYKHHEVFRILEELRARPTVTASTTAQASTATVSAINASTEGNAYGSSEEKCPTSTENGDGETAAVSNFSGRRYMLAVDAPPFYPEDKS